MNFTTLISALPLGIDPVKIALHMFNFLLLMGGLTILLYKPVKKFIENRQNAIQKQLDENAAGKKEAQEMLEEYTQKLENAEKELEELHASTVKIATEEKEAILAEATSKSQELYNKTQADIESEKASAIIQLREEVADVALKLAANILGREVSKEENLDLIDASITEWIENE